MPREYAATGLAFNMHSYVLNTVFRRVPGGYRVAGLKSRAPSW